MGEQEKQIYQLIGEINNSVNEMKDLAHGVYELNRRIGVPPPSDTKVLAEDPPLEKDPEPHTIMDRLVFLRNIANQTNKLLRGAVEDYGQLV